MFVEGMISIIDAVLIEHVQRVFVHKINMFHLYCLTFSLGHVQVNEQLPRVFHGVQGVCWVFDFCCRCLFGLFRSQPVSPNLRKSLGKALKMLGGFVVLAMLCFKV